MGHSGGSESSAEGERKDCRGAEEGRSLVGRSTEEGKEKKKKKVREEGSIKMRCRHMLRSPQDVRICPRRVELAEPLVHVEGERARSETVKDAKRHSERLRLLHTYEGAVSVLPGVLGVRQRAYRDGEAGELMSNRFEGARGGGRWEWSDRARDLADKTVGLSISRLSGSGVDVAV